MASVIWFTLGVLVGVIGVIVISVVAVGDNDFDNVEYEEDEEIDL